MEIEAGWKLDLETRFQRAYFNAPHEKNVIISKEGVFSGIVQSYQWGRDKDIAGKRRALLPRINNFCTSQGVKIVLPQNFPTDYVLNEEILMTKAYYMSLDEHGIERIKTSNSDVSYDYNRRNTHVENEMTNSFLD